MFAAAQAVSAVQVIFCNRISGRHPW